VDPTQQDLSFHWNGLTLEATLHLPAADGPHPVVLMMQGSGPADRDGNGYFPMIREAFLAQRIATYAFDKPGCGTSTGDWRDYALEGRAEQSIAALESLRLDPAIDPGRMGVWGQSQGGWLVQLLAGRDAHISFAMANSGPSIGPAEQDLYGCEHSMRTQGHPEGEIMQALTFIRDLSREAQLGTGYDAVDTQLLSAARDEPWYGYLTIDDEHEWRQGCMFADERYEPTEALLQVRCPFLAIYGGRDVLLPAWQSARESGQALDEAGNPDVTVVVFPNADHRIRHPGTEVFVPGYLDLLGEWAARRAHSGPS
jgi:pimeloyl-ACP methyl ester carboxylesterase